MKQKCIKSLIGVAAIGIAALGALLFLKNRNRGMIDESAEDFEDQEFDFDNTDNNESSTSDREYVPLNSNSASESSTFYSVPSGDDSSTNSVAFGQNAPFNAAPSDQNAENSENQN